MMMKQLLTLLLLLLGLSPTAFAQVQRKLPPCTAVDYSKNKHFGIDGRTEKWHNCIGRYVFELNDEFKGTVYDSEFQSGLPSGKGNFTLPNGDYFIGEFKDGAFNGQGTYYYLADGKYKGDKYTGEFKDNKRNGQGTYTRANGVKYKGEWKDGKKHGQGILTDFDGEKMREGIWINDQFVRAEKINLPSDIQQTDVAINEERRKLDADRRALELERQRLAEGRNHREQSTQASKLAIQISTTNPDETGNVIIAIRTNTDTSSLKINGEEQGGRSDGNYTIKKVARIGQETQFTITATDINGNTDSKSITVSRKTVESTVAIASLNPENIKKRTTRDAVAVIIGISDYKSLPRSDFAKDDAQVFYDYAIRALGVKPENIKLLLDSDAEEVEIFKAFKTWLPARVKSTTDVYVFYSGHGLPTSDGLGLYLLPYRADRDLISKTAVQFQEINNDIQATKPKSVTIFMDACYSGQSRGGETLIASARPLALKAQTSIFPSGFNVFSASQSDQISSSSPDLKHGIFSYYLMKGMEGDADLNKDGKITFGEMQSYLSENVGRQAGMMNRKQEPQLIGDLSKVLVGK
jgi:hypothetical protein